MLSYTVNAGTTAAKIDYWNEAMREVFRSSWHVLPFQPLDFQMSMKAVPLAHGMSLSQATLSQAQIINCPSHTNDSTEHPFYIYLVTRTQHVEIGSRSFVLKPGDFTIADSALMSTLTTKSPYTTIGLTVPAKHLRLYIPMPEQAIGIPFSGNAGLSNIVSNMLTAMWSMAESNTFQGLVNKLSANLLEIVSACCYSTCGQSLPNDISANLKQKRIKLLIDNELRNPELSVTALAHQLGLSSRYLQTLFARENDTITAYIRRQRLQGCQRQLLDPIWKNHSITEIAFSWGFNNATHFSRVFKEQFGVSAREYRKES